jgi:DNA-binding transcriptional ArsR family regulator
VTELLSIIAEPRRQQILRLVWDGEAAAGAIAEAMPDVTFGAVSQHLRVLRDAGLVDVRRDGRFRRYRANRGALGPLADYLAGMWSDHLVKLKTLSEAVEGSHDDDERGS